jgi:hypothetical protein
MTLAELTPALLTPEQQYIERLRHVIPPEMQAERRWTQCFQVAKSTPGMAGKVPCSSHSDPNTWLTFDEVCHSSFKMVDGVWVREEDAPLRPGRGIGFQFLDSEYLPIDIDHIRNKENGQWCSEAKILVSKLQTYTEWSVSGTGLHCIGLGSIRQKQLTTQHIQFWNGRLGVPRYFWLTGNVLGDDFTKLRDCSEEFQMYASHPRMFSVKMQEELTKIDPEQAASLPPESAAPIEEMKEKNRTKTRKVVEGFDIEDFLKFYDLKIINRVKNEVGQCYRVNWCPWKGSPHAGHNDTTCNFIYPTSDGGLGFKCHSTGCCDESIHSIIKRLAEDHGPYPKAIYQEKPAQSAQIKQTITIHRADTVKREATKWLIPGFIPLCEATAFSGEMDTRKSTTALDIAAKGSRGFRWSQKVGEDAHDTHDITPPFSTIYAGTEDSFHSTVLNRFLAAGGNIKAFGNISLDVVNEKNSSDGVETWSTSLSFDAHMNALHDAITAFNKEALHPVGLLINDPLIAFFGDKNFNKAQDCQVILKGLKRLCEELNISIINLMHFNKTQGATAKEKTGGSQRLIEAHRMAWSFTLMDDTDKDSHTLIAPIKKNLLKVAKSYEITTVSTPVEWEEDGVKKQDTVGVVQFVRLSDETTEGQLLEKASKDRSKQREVREGILGALMQGPVSPANVISSLEGIASKPSIERQASWLVRTGKIKRSGTGPSNTLWMLAAEPHQAEFDGSH